LLRLVKGRNQAEAATQAARKQGDELPEAEITFGRLVLDQDISSVDTVAVASAIEEVSAQALLDQAAVLDPFERNCVGCPVNLGREPFGCMLVIHYPIPAAAETWLVDRLPPDLGSPAGKALTAAIRDFRYRGRPIREMRAFQGRYFEQDVPVRRKWGRGLFSYTVTSDLLLEMMIGLGELEWAHCFLLTILLGVVPFDAPP
jgi:hypothetical protein